MTVKPARFQRIVEVFERALAVAPAERLRFVAEECIDDPRLQRKLVALLQVKDTGPAVRNSI